MLTQTEEQNEVVNDDVVESHKAPATHEELNQFGSGVLLAISGTFLFALKPIFIKLAFAAGAGPTLLLTVRMLFALPFYVVVLWKLRTSENRQPLQQSHIL